MRCQSKQRLQERGKGRDPTREKNECTRRGDITGRKERIIQQTQQVLSTYGVFGVLMRSSGQWECIAIQNRH